MTNPVYLSLAKSLLDMLTSEATRYLTKAKEAGRGGYSWLNNFPSSVWLHQSKLFQGNCQISVSATSCYLYVFQHTFQFNDLICVKFIIITASSNARFSRIGSFYTRNIKMKGTMALGAMDLIRAIKPCAFPTVYRASSVQISTYCLQIMPFLPSTG
jgi:hypothetical protein